MKVKTTTTSTLISISNSLSARQNSYLHVESPADSVTSKRPPSVDRVVRVQELEIHPIVQPSKLGVSSVYRLWHNFIAGQRRCKSLYSTSNEFIKRVFMWGVRLVQSFTWTTWSFTISNWWSRKDLSRVDGRFSKQSVQLMVHAPSALFLSRSYFSVDHLQTS